MKKFLWHSRHLPELLELMVGLAIGAIYLWGLAPLLSQPVQIGSKVVPCNLIVLALIMLCAAISHKSLHLWLVHELKRRGWSDPSVPS